MKKFSLTVFTLFAMICHGVLWEDVADSKKVVFSANDPFGIAISSNLQATVTGIPALAVYGTNTANRLGVFAADTSNKFSIVSGRLDDHTSTLQGLTTRIDSTETRQTAVEASFTETRVSVTGISSRVSTALQTASNALTKAEQALAVVPGPDEPMVRAIVASSIAPVSAGMFGAISNVGDAVTIVYTNAMKALTIANQAIDRPASGIVKRLYSEDDTGAFNTISGSAIYQQTIDPGIPEAGFMFSVDFGANGVIPPQNLALGTSIDGWSAGMYQNPYTGWFEGMRISYSNCVWRGQNTFIDGEWVDIYTSDGLHGETGIATNLPFGRPGSTNTVIYRIGESPSLGVISNNINSHINSQTPHTNAVAWFIRDLGTNGVLGVVSSNGVFSVVQFKE